MINNPTFLEKKLNDLIEENSLAGNENNSHIGQCSKQTQSKSLSIGFLSIQKMPLKVKVMIEANFQNVVQLCIVNCDLRTFQNFPKLSNLKNLNVSKNSLRGSFQFLVKNRSIKYIDASNNIIGDIKKFEPLSYLKNLELYVQDNPFLAKKPEHQHKAKSEEEEYFKKLGISYLKKPKVTARPKKQQPRAKDLSAQKQMLLKKHSIAELLMPGRPSRPVPPEILRMGDRSIERYMMRQELQVRNSISGIRRMQERRQRHRERQLLDMEPLFRVRRMGNIEDSQPFMQPQMRNRPSDELAAFKIELNAPGRSPANNMGSDSDSDEDNNQAILHFDPDNEDNCQLDEQDIDDDEQDNEEPEDDDDSDSDQIIEPLRRVRRPGTQNAGSTSLISQRQRQQLALMNRAELGELNDEEMFDML